MITPGITKREETVTGATKKSLCATDALSNSASNVKKELKKLHNVSPSLLH
jgi:hypothetical protein